MTIQSSSEESQESLSEIIANLVKIWLSTDDDASPYQLSSSITESEDLPIDRANRVATYNARFLRPDPQPADLNSSIMDEEENKCHHRASGA